MATKLKSSAEITDELTRPPVPPAEPSNPLHEAITREMEQAERDFRATRERLRAEGIALGELRKPACEAIDKLRRLVEIVIGGRRFHALAQARAITIEEAVIRQLSGGVTDLGILLAVEQNDPPAATCARLVGLIAPWLANKEKELSDTIDEARKLVQSAPDNEGMLAEVAQLAVSVA